VTTTPLPDDLHLAAARALLARHPVLDGHNDLPWEIRKYKAAPGDLGAYDLRTRAPAKGQTDLPRLRAGGVGGQFWSVYVPGEGTAGRAVMQLEQLDLARRMIDRYPEDLAYCATADEVDAALADGKIASLLGMEGGHVLEGSLGALRAFYALGARYLTLTHNQSNDLADSATGEVLHGGLSDLGRKAVAEMNRLGMLVDLSHTSPATMSDALDASHAPVVFSHSSARALCDVARNVPDEILRRMPANGGVVMVTFVAGFVSDDAAAILIPAIAEFTRRAAGMTDVAAREAMAEEIIDSLEPERRGPYSGALGYVAYGDRTMDLAITIRTCVIAGGEASIGAGAGIVADSVPEREWDETEAKARAMLTAIGQARAAGR